MRHYYWLKYFTKKVLNLTNFSFSKIFYNISCITTHINEIIPTSLIYFKYFFCITINTPIIKTRPIYYYKKLKNRNQLLTYNSCAAEWYKSEWLISREELWVLSTAVVYSSSDFAECLEATVSSRVDLNRLLSSELFKDKREALKLK